MYRRPGRQSVLGGVPSGPFTGPRRSFDSATLPPATRRRLVDALSGRAEPSPIAYERPSGLPTGLASWGVVLSVFSLSVLFAIGFDNPSSRWALQPAPAVVLYMASGALFAFSLRAVLRRRALLGDAALRPGTYLLPLDVVRGGLPDARGVQAIEVDPLGEAREASVEKDGPRTRVTIAFEDGRVHTFPLRGDASGDIALRRLEHAQGLLEELTYGAPVGRAFAADPFFDVRGAWPSVESEPETIRRPPLVLRRASKSIALAAGLGIAIAGFATRNAVGDRVLFARASHAATVEAIDTYLARGGARRDEALALRHVLVYARAQEAREDASRAAAQGRGDADRAAEELADSRDRCVAMLRARSALEHPDVPRLVERYLAQGGRDVAVRFTHRVQRAPAAAGDVAAHLDRRESVLAWAFERVFSETCPASVLRFGIAGPRPAEPPPVAELEIRYDVTWPSTTAPAFGMTTVFDVAFIVPGEAPARFRLTMPPPASAPTGTRPWSLYVLHAPQATDPDGSFALEASTARAFDRLYDELYGLFFSGDPRVPLRESEGVR